MFLSDSFCPDCYRAIQGLKDGTGIKKSENTGFSVCPYGNDDCPICKTNTHTEKNIILERNKEFESAKEKLSNVISDILDYRGIYDCGKNFEEDVEREIIPVIKSFMNNNGECSNGHKCSICKKDAFLKEIELDFDLKFDSIMDSEATCKEDMLNYVFSVIKKTHEYLNKDY